MKRVPVNTLKVLRILTLVKHFGCMVYEFTDEIRIQRLTVL